MNEVIFHEIDRNVWCEVRYLDGIIDYLNNNIDNYSIIATPNFNFLPETKYKKIVLLTGDESGRAGMRPYYKYPDVVAVFRIYNLLGRFDNKKIFPIPCGYNWTMHDDQSKKMIKMYPEKKLSERTIDIFYAGQPLPWRMEMINNLNNIKNYNISCNVSNTFRTGIHIDEYYKLLGDSKIALSPDGTSVDCFRLTEALGSGCIVITTKKEDLWYYRNSPIVFINNWSELNQKLIDDILSSNLDEHYSKNLEYYNNTLSENAVGKYIIDCILK
jgi:hypothetical protein